MNETPRNQLVVTAVLIAVAAAVVVYSNRSDSAGGPIKVGILHSETGTMAISERSVRDATLLAIEEINEAGGLLGARSKRSSSTANPTGRHSLARPSG